MADSNRTEVAYVAETTWGVVPASPTLQTLRMTGESMTMETSVVDSAEIRSDRQKSDTIRTAISVTGDINYELSYGTYDDFLVAALFASAWSTAVSDVSADTGISVVASSNSFVGADGDFDGYSVGEWIEVSGCANAANNGIFKIASISSSNPGVSDNDTLAIVQDVLVDESAGEAVTIKQGSSITNGTTVHSFTIEREYTDVASAFAYYTGMTINSWSLSIDQEAVISGSFSFMGAEETWAASTVGTGTNTAESTTKIMNSVDGLENLYEDGSSYEAISFSLELQNNLRLLSILGQLAKDGIGTGLCNVTGTLQAYFSGIDAMTKYKNFTSTSLAMVLKDSAGNRYVLDIPEVKLTAGQAAASGQSTDIIADFSWSAMADPTEDVTIRIVRLPAA